MKKSRVESNAHLRPSPDLISDSQKAGGRFGNTPAGGKAVVMQLLPAKKS